MKKYFLVFVSVLLIIIKGEDANAQSVSVYGGGLGSPKLIVSGGFDAEVSDSLYLGSGTHTIDGTWEIYSSYVLIDPTAVISGSGKIIFYNPSLAFGSSVSNIIDANNISSSIEVDVEIQNDQNVTLADQSFPAEFISVAGWTETAAASTLYTGKDLNLAADGAHIVLASSGTGNLKLDPNATISNYRPSRMVVTNNSVGSHMIKENYSGAFVFPVGIASGDYTPAEITNASANTVSVSVQDYVNSASPEATADPGPSGVPADGMNRTWHIFGQTAGIGAGIKLQHNTSTNQSGFIDAAQYVTQWGSTTPNATGDFYVEFSTSPWQSNVAGAGTTGNLVSPVASLAGSMAYSRSYAALAISAAANESYFTKSSDPYHPLPLALTKLNTSVNNCAVSIQWSFGIPSRIDHFGVQHSNDGFNFQTIGTIYSSNAYDYQYKHVNAGKGKHLYRLKLVEKDGKVSYSSIIQRDLNCNEPEIDVRIYPNPANDLIFIDQININKKGILRILSMDGRIVLEQNIESDKVSVDVSKLIPATYIVQLLLEGQNAVNTNIIKL